MRILVVDDEEDIRTIAKLSLEAVGGHEVVVASGASEALELAHAHKPDLVLLDMMMPVMDGLAALAELRRDPEFVDLPVVFMTARVQRHEVERYLRLGATGVVHKPFDPMTLAQEVERIVGRAPTPR